jgi:hypothetical protein
MSQNDMNTPPWHYWRSKGEELPEKNPVYAGTLAIVPGLGHAYVPRYRDAIVSFLVNGLFIWAAVQAFHFSPVEPVD